MKSNNLKPFEGEKYRTGGAAGVHTMFITISLCALLIWYCQSFSHYIEFRKFGSCADDILYMFGIIGGFVLAIYIVTLLSVLILNRETFIEVDKNGIRGKGKASYLSYDDFSYRWDEISSISFLLNRIIIRKGDQTYTHALSFVFRRNAKFLSALHTFGGERLLSEKKIKTIQLIHKLIPVVIFALGFIYTIGILGQDYCKPYDYAIHDFVIVGDDTYAVGHMWKEYNNTDRPVVWKNGVIQEEGPLGLFNAAELICEMGGDIYVISSVGDEYILSKNNEKFISLEQCQSLAHYQSMFAVEDTLYISELNKDEKIEKYNREDIVSVYKYVKGDTELQRVPNEDIPDGLFEQITTHLVLTHRMFDSFVAKGKYSTMEEEPDCYYMKLSGNDIYLLEHGTWNVWSRIKSQVDISIWRYVEQYDTYSFERVY